MIRVRQVKVEIEKKNLEEIKRKTATKLGIKSDDILKIKILKESIDARRKEEVHYSYEVAVCLKNEKQVIRAKHSSDIEEYQEESYAAIKCGNQKLMVRPIIVGSGPAGLFAAYLLAEYGYQPLIIERGEKIEDRVQTVERFWKDGTLNENSNVSFGEGGAGTFSDGKLNTLVKDEKNRIKKVMETLVSCGSEEDILYVQKPHIGTDLLRNVIIHLRERIIEMGGEFRYHSQLTDIKIDNGKVIGIEINHDEILSCEVLVLAIGHSARDTFQMLYDKKLDMKAKPFAIGVRIQHPQAMINENQYHTYADKLPNASYKLTYQASNKRGVYSFCMCPGGYVVNSSSEKGYLAINGMSNHKRESSNANSAIVVTVTPDDFGKGPLDGIEYQRKLEKLAYQKGNGKIPIQLWKDFKEGVVSKKFGKIEPIFKGNYDFVDLNEVLPGFISESLKEAIPYFDTKINGFAREDTILAGVESRTSSPVRIERGEELTCNIAEIYPCGEGAGYAGGITTAAVDGIKIAEKIIEKYSNEFINKSV